MVTLAISRQHSSCNGFWPLAIVAAHTVASPTPLPAPSPSTYSFVDPDRCRTLFLLLPLLLLPLLCCCRWLLLPLLLPLLLQEAIEKTDSNGKVLPEMVSRHQGDAAVQLHRYNSWYNSQYSSRQW